MDGREVSVAFKMYRVGFRNVPTDNNTQMKFAEDICGRYSWKIGKYHVVCEMYRVGFWNVPTETEAQMKFAEDICGRSGRYLCHF